MGHAVALALVGLGTAVIVGASLGALVMRSDELTKVHFLSPITSLGAPLVGAGVCVAQGWGITSGEIALVLGMLAVAGPVQSAATGRLVAQIDGILETAGPT